MPTPLPLRRNRLIVATAFSLGAALYVLARAWDYALFDSDLDPQLCAARVWWAGGDPYAATGLGRQCSWGFAQFYPATSFVALGPLMWLPTVVARAVFCSIATFALVMALTRDGWYRLPVLASAAFQSTLARAQWEPFFVAAVVYPLLGGFWVCKPNIGLISAAGLGKWRHAAMACAGGLVLLAVSLARDPTWPLLWRDALRTNVQTVALFPLSILGLLALRRWKEGPARMTAAFGLVPMSHLPYATALLFLTPRTWRQACALALASDFGLMTMLAGGPYHDFLATTGFYARWAAPAALAVAVWSVWSKPAEAQRVPRVLVTATVAAGIFVLWLSFALSGLPR